jgi:serine-type D-Ala-D-Ala carboxypeptidase
MVTNVKDYYFLYYIIWLLLSLNYGFVVIMSFKIRIEVPQSSEIREIVEEGVKSLIAVSFSVALFSREKLFVGHYGNSVSGLFYDLASLTKPLGTATMIMGLVEKGRLKLNDSVSSLLGSNGLFSGKTWENIKIWHLLNHTSGLGAYSPYFLTISTLNDLKKAISSQIPLLDPGESTVYSDLGFMILGFILQKLEDNLWYENLYSSYFQTLSLENDICFTPLNKNFIYADNEEPSWETLHGKAHDENSRIIGSGAGHAGLFATAKGVATILSDLGRQFRGENSESSFPGTHGVKKMFSPVKSSDRFALGWDRPSTSGYTSAGIFPPQSSVGHLGFTGTAMWYEPIEDRGAILLCNRVNNGRESKLQELRKLRPRFFTAAWKFLEQSI